MDHKPSIGNNIGFPVHRSFLFLFSFILAAYVLERDKNEQRHMATLSKSQIKNYRAGLETATVICILILLNSCCIIIMASRALVQFIIRIFVCHTRKIAKA